MRGFHVASYTSQMQMLNLEMADNSTTETSTTVNVTIETQPVTEGGYLFESLHGNQVTAGTLSISIVIILIGIWIIILNCLLIQTLVKCRLQLEVTDIFVHSLAITDALLGIVLLYNSAYNIINFQNRYECLVRFGLLQALLLNSTGHISLLTINRYIKIVKPFQYRNIFKKWRIIILSGSVWCFSMIFGFSPLMGWNKEYKPAEGDESHLVCRYFGVMHPAFILVNVTIYWIPLILMIVTYTHVCKIAYRHSSEIRSHERHITGKDSGLFDRRSWRFTKTVFIIIGVYFFCWLSTGIYFMVQLSGALDNISYTVQGNILNYTTTLGFLNSLLNPIIYATKIPCVKHRFQKVFCCKDIRASRRQSVQSDVFHTTNSLSISRRLSTISSSAASKLSTQS